MPVSLLALALSAFAIGTTEFVIMGWLATSGYQFLLLAG